MVSSRTEPAVEEPVGVRERPLDCTAAVRARAGSLGFDVVGIARADEPLDLELDRYRAFVEAGMHGQMTWLGDDVEARRRLDGEAILPGARSVVCVGRRYARSAAAEDRDPPLAKKIARYARGQDYHVFLRKKLRRLAAFVRTLGPAVRARPICDVEPVLERAWAARAGLGFVGKNGLVIAPREGSFMLLGEVVTTLELVPDVPIAERCGSCTRCLDACPTGAFAEPFVLDPRKCISYWTIEARGAPPEALREQLGEHLFGCDVCQDVCPFNASRVERTGRATQRPSKFGFSPGSMRPRRAATPQFEPHARWNEARLADLVALDQDGFRSLTEGSPLHRAGPEGLARNAVLVAAARLGSGGGAVGDEPELGDARRAIAGGRAHRDEGVREVSVWAEGQSLRRLGVDPVQHPNLVLQPSTPTPGPESPAVGRGASGRGRG